MHINRQRVATVVGAGLILAVGSTLGSYAANGGPLLLGKSNTASKTTTIKTTSNKPVLKLKGKKTKPPLKVNSSIKVSKFNADLVDGLDAADLQNKTYTYNLSGSTTSGGLVFALPGLPAGKYLATVNLSAQIEEPTGFFACAFAKPGGFVDPKLFGIGTFAILGFTVSVAGVLDTTTGARSLACQASTQNFTIPIPELLAQATFTRIDSVTAANSAGVPGSASGREFVG